MNMEHYIVTSSEDSDLRWVELKYLIHVKMYFINECVTKRHRSKTLFEFTRIILIFWQPISRVRREWNLSANKKMTTGDLCTLHDKRFLLISRISHINKMFSGVFFGPTYHIPLNLKCVVPIIKKLSKDILPSIDLTWVESEDEMFEAWHWFLSDLIQFHCNIYVFNNCVLRESDYKCLLQIKTLRISLFNIL